jgi:hypothetical protein
MKTMPTSNNEATELHRSLASRSKELSVALTIQDLEKALQQPRTHKDHPIAALIRRAFTPYDTHEAQVLANLDRALKSCHVDHTHGAILWSRKQLQFAANEVDFQNAAALLAEIRAFGALWGCGLTVTRVRTGDERKRDFDANLRGRDPFGIEVHCKQMNAPEAKELADFLHSGPGFHTIYPAGKLKPGESTAENMASKFASIKSRAGQAAEGMPNVLWCDLQDEDWWVLNASYALPVVTINGSFFSGGLWHAFYGQKGTPIFEANTTEETAEKVSYFMRHDGLFKQSQKWDLAVLSFPSETVLFENPHPEHPLPSEEIEALIRLPWFNFDVSRFNWPPPSKLCKPSRLDYLLKMDLLLLESLQNKAIYQIW